MAAPYVTGAEILVNVGNSPGSATDQAWAAKCAAAIDMAAAPRKRRRFQSIG